MYDESKNQRTLAAYENIAAEYADLTKGTPTAVNQLMLERFLDSLPPGAAVLELGSGPGWDADFVESLGVRVRRTDATAAFRDLQGARSKHVDSLDAITDEYIDRLWPTYDGVMALFVLQHIERDDTDTVLRKVAQALRPGGAFLVVMREGVGDVWEGSPSGNRYHVTQWDPAAFEARLDAVELETLWTTHFVDDEGPWFGVVARKTVSSGSGGETDVYDGRSRLA